MFTVVEPVSLANKLLFSVLNYYLFTEIKMDYPKKVTKLSENVLIGWV